jgi:hypothetical protein
MAVDQSPPAFPLSREQEGWHNPGMSLRDWFAGQAIQVAFSKIEDGLTDWERCNLLNKTKDQLGGETQEEMTAALAYRLADELVKRRAKQEA